MSKLVRITDGEKEVTVTNVAGKKAMDVNVASLTLDGQDDTVGLVDANGDRLAVTENGALATGNAVKKFRDGFVTGSPDLTIWNQAWSSQGDSFVFRGGNAAGSSYLGISMDPTQADAEYTLWTKRLFKLPSRFIFSHSQSQRFLGQELEISLQGAVDSTSVVDRMSDILDMGISGTITVATNVATINFATDHPYKGGDRVLLFGNTDSRMNVGPVLVTVITKRQITIPLTIANASYTAGGFVRWADVTAMAKNAVGICGESATLTTSTYFARRNGASVRQLPITMVTTTATQSNTSGYTDAFNAAGTHELTVNMQETLLTSRTSDNTSASATTTTRWSQGIPDEELQYVINIRAKNLTNMTKPVAKIVTISKTGTTTATVTTQAPHGLTTSSFVQISGVRDIVNFPNLAATQVSSVISPTQFTIVIGGAVTATSAGGAVILQQGQAAQAGLTGLSVQSISRSNNVLTITMDTTAVTALPGEFWHLYGCDATSIGLYDGPYRILRVTGSTYEVESTGVDFGSISCGGLFLRRTDHRIHFVHELEYTRHLVEIANQNGGTDAARAVPVTVVGSSVLSTVSTVSVITSANLGLPSATADVASAAITTTTTTSAITPTFGPAYTVVIPVTAFSGTNPTLDVSIEESDDTGVNWYKVYDFPRITGTGINRSPQLRLRGNRVRYVQTLTGTSPSFTRSVTRLQANHSGDKIAQLIDRTIVPNTLSSTSAALYVEGLQDFNIQVRCSAQSTPATIDLQVSEDGTNYVTVSGASITTAVGIVRSAITNIQAKFARLIVTSAGTGVTLTEAILKGVGQ